MGLFLNKASNFPASSLTTFLAKIGTSVAVFGMATGAISGFAHADDAEVSKGLEDATALFSQRSATDPSPIEKAIKVLSGLEGKADDSDLNYKVLILESRALYWKGQHVPTVDERINTHALGQAKADQAKQVNDGYADAYYFAGINLARWGEAKGVVAALYRKGELIKYMNDTISKMTMDEKPGESLDGYGPDRVLGRLSFKLPALLGGSHKDSVEKLKKAYENAKSLALNTVYYAETLNAGDATEKALAKSILDELLAQDPAKLDPSRVPEALDEFQEGRELRGQMN